MYAFASVATCYLFMDFKKAMMFARVSALDTPVNSIFAPGTSAPGLLIQRSSVSSVQTIADDFSAAE
jgi:hypothetical protein